MAIEDRGAATGGRARAYVTGGFTWQPPSYDSGVAFVVEPANDAPATAGVGTLLLGAAFWIAVFTMTMLSFQAPHASSARTRRASAARPVFVAQPPVEAPSAAVVSFDRLGGTASVEANAPLTPVASTVKPVEWPRPSRGPVEGVPSVRPSPPPRDAKPKSAQADDESALALDTLTRSRLETSF